MPELPEVETIVQDLKKRIIGSKIKKVEVRLGKMVKNRTSDFIAILEGNSFRNIRRRGKFLIFDLKKGAKVLIIHLRMTGQLIYRKGENVIAGGHSEDNEKFDLPGKHTHLVFHFANSEELFYNDIRQFGIAYIIPNEEENENLAHFGIEPLGKAFSLKKFKELLKNKKSNIKAFLLSQKYIVGIGNIYADEILFASHVSPLRTIDTLKVKEVALLHKNIKKILKKAIVARGTTFNNYVDADGNKGGFKKYLKVYQRAGKLCKSCKKVKISKIRVAGRGTHYCHKCQK